MSAELSLIANLCKTQDANMIDRKGNQTEVRSYHISRDGYCQHRFRIYIRMTQEQSPLRGTQIIMLLLQRALYYV